MSDDSQKLIDVAFQMCLMIHEKREYFEGKTKEEVTAWITRQLECCGFDATPSLDLTATKRKHKKPLKGE